MQLSLRLAQPRLFHRDGLNAIAAWRGEAGNVPLRLLRDGRVGPGRRVQASFALSVLALCTLALAGLAAAALLPPRSPSGAALQAADVSVPAVISEREVGESGISEREVALALQAAGALSGPLPGRERPALRFGAVPDLPMPDSPSTVATTPQTSPGIPPATDSRVEPASTAPASIQAPAARPLASEPAPGNKAEPAATASLPRRAGAALHPREAAAPAARPHPVVLASRGAKPPAARPSADPETAWTLPRSLAPTEP